MANPNLTGAPRDKNFIPVITTYNNIGSGRKTVTTAGTAVALASSQTEVKRLDVQALYNNTKSVAIGDSNVVASPATARGVTLQPGNVYTFYVTDLSLVYVDSEVNTEGVQYTYYW